MQSLGGIYQTLLGRIEENRRKRGLSGSSALLTSQANPPLAESLCPKCKGGGFVTHLVPVEHPEFGEVFRCNCQEQHAKAILLKTAQLPEREQSQPRTLDTFEPVPGAADALGCIRAMVDGEFGWNILTLLGPNGTGKTHLLEALGRASVEKGIVVRYLHAPTWIEELRAGSAQDAAPSRETLWGYLDSVELLLLDDLTEWKVTPFAVEQVGRLVDEKYRSGELLVVATNLEVRIMANVWDRRLADRLFDESSGRVARLTGASYRTGQDWGER
jgi:DNA replication protein DnaC